MPELGFVAYMIAVGYGLGVVWYTLLNRKPTSWMRMAAFPFIGVVVGEGLWVKYFAGGPTFFDLHIAVVLVATLTAVIVDLSLQKGTEVIHHETRSRTSSGVTAGSIH